jgi:hypothetical protein
MPKECPMCGESMVIMLRRQQVRLPGTAETHPREIREWTCRECDYFEEVADDDEAER